MKKFLSVLLAVVFIFGVCAPAYAEDDTRQTELSFIYEPDEPSYIVTIPGVLQLEPGENPLEIVLDKYENIGKRTVEIFFAGTNLNVLMSNELYFTHLTAKNRNSIGYKLIDDEYNDVSDENFRAQTGAYLAALTADDNIKNIYLYINVEIYLAEGFLSNTMYDGYIYFGIKLI